jgi:hypothetical protein
LRSPKAEAQVEASVEAVRQRELEHEDSTRGEAAGGTESYVVGGHRSRDASVDGEPVLDAINTGSRHMGPVGQWSSAR